VRALFVDPDGNECYPHFVAAAKANLFVISFFLEECGMSVQMTTPRTKENVLHYFSRSKPKSQINAVTLLKYLVEGKGLDFSETVNADGADAWCVACKLNRVTYLNYFLSAEAGRPKSVSTLAPSDEWEGEEDEKTAEKSREALMSEAAEQSPVYHWFTGEKNPVNAVGKALRARKEAREKEAARVRNPSEAEVAALRAETQAKAKEAAVMFEQQDAQAKEAAAALLAELEAEDREAAAAAEKKKAKKSKKKKGAAGQQVGSTSSTAARSFADRAPRLEESKADDKKPAPQPRSSSSEEKEEEQQQQQQQQQQQEEEEEQQQQQAPPDAPDEGAIAAVGMDDLSSEEEERADAVTSATAMGKEEESSGEGGEEDLEEEKHDFLFEGAPDVYKCSVGFCFMTEAVLAMDGFSYQKASLEAYIVHCTARGQALTSPLTGEPMGGMYMPNHTLSTVVKDYIEQKEKEWKVLVAQRRAERKGK
jgi:hypothetical protein